MTEVDYIRKMETFGAGQLWAQVTASNGETITVDFRIRGALIMPNVANAETSSWGITFTAGEKQATVSLTGNDTDVACSVILWGDQ